MEDIYYGDNIGHVYQLDIGDNDDGAIITKYFVVVVSGNNPTAENPMSNGHEYRKYFTESETFIKPEQATLSMSMAYATDLFDSEQIRVPGNYTDLGAETISEWAGTGIKHKRIRFFGVNGKTLALKWTHAALTQNFTFYPGEIHYQWKSRNPII